MILHMAQYQGEIWIFFNFEVKLSFFFLKNVSNFIFSGEKNSEKMPLKMLE